MNNWSPEFALAIEALWGFQPTSFAHYLHEAGRLAEVHGLCRSDTTKLLIASGQTKPAT